MSQPIPLNHEEQDLEGRLRSLVPSSHGLQRDNLMFQAGRRAGRRHLVPWQATSAVLLAGSLTLGWLSLDPEPRPDPSLLVQVEPIAETTRPAMHQSSPSPGRIVLAKVTHPSEYSRLRELVLLEGVDALPDAPAAPMADTTELGADWPPDVLTLQPPFHLFRPYNHGDRS
jgi:hypothetical protein